MICVNDTENGVTEKIAGFQSFVQPVGYAAQQYEMEGHRLWRRLEDGDVSFCGAFLLPQRLIEEHTIM